MRFVYCLLVVLICNEGLAQNLTTKLTSLNSAFDEQNPFLSPDGRTLFLTIANHPQNIGGKKDPGDIWISTFNGETWSPPVHGGESINDRSYNAVAGLVHDGSKLFIHNHFDAHGNTARTQGISVAERTGSGWSRPTNIYIPYFQNRSPLVGGTVSRDGKYFVFAAETYGTYGVEDIYVSINDNGKWSEPKNLGPAINTSFQELTPTLSADSKTIYFSSNGRKGSGSFDVFRADRLDDTWTNWSNPENLGTGVNTSGRELYFRPNQLGYALYTSTLNSDGYGDIKMYVADKPISISDTAAVIVSIDTTTTVNTASIQEEPVLTVRSRVNPDVIVVRGKVINAKTGEPIQANVTVSANAHTQTVASSSNGYTIDLPQAREYTVTIEAVGFISTIDKLHLDSLKANDLEMIYSLQPAEVGATVNLKNVLFAQAKTDILPESFSELDVVVSFLKTNPRVKIDLTGHTDNRGVHADNVRLSQQRVNKVKEYLVSKGIDSRRITGKGYGGTKPIASNDTEESRKMNRRVEFTIRKN